MDPLREQPSRRDGAAVVARVADVSLRLGKAEVLSGVGFVLPAGTITVAAGPNGAGKTCLSRLLVSAMTPTQGSVTRAPGSRVAYVPQGAALYPYLTVAENCRASGRMEGLRGAALTQRVTASMRLALCEPVADTRAAHLSGGYGRRAAIAAAAMGRPDLMVLDEPTAGLDADASREIAQALRIVRDEGTTLFVTTHDFDFADALADRVLFFRRGRLIAGGAPPVMVEALFGGAKRIDVALGEDGTAAPRQLSLYRRLGPDGAGAVVRELEQQGLAVRELRLREPGIATLYERFCAASPPR